MMKKMVVVLLACLTACTLCACGTKCRVYEECGKTIEKSSENKNPAGKGYLCEEHLEEFERQIEEAIESGMAEDREGAIEYYKDFFN